MSVVKCNYCHVRIPPRQLPLHLKKCINYRRMLKAGTIDLNTVEQNKTIAGSLGLKTTPKLTKAQIKAAKKAAHLEAQKSNGNKTSQAKDQTGKKDQK